MWIHPTPSPSPRHVRICTLFVKGGGVAEKQSLSVIMGGLEGFPPSRRRRNASQSALHPSGCISAPLPREGYPESFGFAILPRMLVTSGKRERAMRNAITLSLSQFRRTGKTLSSIAPRSMRRRIRCLCSVSICFPKKPSGDFLAGRLF